MNKVYKQLKKNDKIIDISNVKNPKMIMSSNLPLLIANGRPRSLDTISLFELEEFVPFMVLCSLGHELHKRPKEINNCPVPEWWPQGFPFKFPLVDRNFWISRVVMLKMLVCRCYTFYDSEFLLKFSAELAEKPPSHLKFEPNKDECTTSIFDAITGKMLVKCRNENLNYDMHKNRRRYLSPTHRPSMSSPKKHAPVIDLTFDTSSEDEKEVYFKEPSKASQKSLKRKASTESSEESSAKQKCVRRVFYDFPEEKPEPFEYNQEQFMDKFSLVPLGKQIVLPEFKVERKKRLAHSFSVLSVTSKRGQELLARNKHTFNLEACLERIERFTGPNSLEETENCQMSTRASATYGKVLKEDVKEENEEVEDVNDKLKWCHTYKWPHRTSNVVYNHKGPSLKPSSVQLELLSDKEIYFWAERKRSVGTNTPQHWWEGKALICDCQKIPLIELDDDPPPKTQDKGNSTRCTCSKVKVKPLLPQVKKAPLESNHQNMQIKPEASVRPRLRNISESVFHGKGTFDVSSSGYTHFPSHSYSSDAGGLTSISYNSVPKMHTYVHYKNTVQRRPLAVVSPTAVDIEKEMPDMGSKSALDLPHETNVSSSAKISFRRSISDAIKWYIKEDPVMTVAEDQNLKDDCVMFDRSQENVKPLSKLTLPNSLKPLDYFNANLNNSGRDYCFERSTFESSKLVTRRGGRHYVNREPCPSCFEGKDNFCVYEFIRQAKLAGIALSTNQKQLQAIFFNFIKNAI